MQDAPPPPDGLAEAGQALWRAVFERFELGHHEMLILREAARTVDRLDRLAEEGRDAELVTTNFKGDPVANPLLVEARQQQIVLARLLAALRLPDDETDTRPQRRGAPRGTYSGGYGKTAASFWSR
jgi:hypothetical protein